MGFFSKLVSSFKGTPIQPTAPATVTIMPVTNDADHNHYFLTGSEMIEPYMRLHGVPEKSAKSNDARRDILRGMGLLNAVVAYNKDNWAAWWTIGKGWQALGEPDKACDAFAKSYSIQRQNPDVAREYMLECLNLGRTDEAVSAAESALNLSPNDAGLNANLALAYTIAGRLSDAQSTIAKSLQIDPQDKISQNLHRIIKEIIDGKRSQPHNMDDIQGR
jgi:tetratricopeptide (TPR) repeat protein